MPPAQPAGGVSPQQQPTMRDQFVAHINRHAYIPVWLHPDVAKGVIQHFGRDGSALVHPHPNTGHPAYATGGMAQATPPVQAAPAARPPAPAAVAMAGRAPLAGMPARAALGAPGDAGQSIFGGGALGAGGPTQQAPVLAQRGAIMDGRGGAGRVPGRDMGKDSVHAMLEPGELVANKKQLRGLQVKPGKAHLLRDDQKKALKQAHKKDAR